MSLGLNIVRWSVSHHSLLVLKGAESLSKILVIGLVGLVCTNSCAMVQVNWCVQK